MKAFEFSLDKEVFTGLRQFGGDIEEENKLLECFNLAPSKEGLEIHEELSYPTNLSAFLLLEDGDYLLLKTEEDGPFPNYLRLV